MLSDRIFKKLAAFKTDCTLDDIARFKAVVKKQISADRKLKTKASIKRIKDNEEWLLVYDIILNDTFIQKNNERILTRYVSKLFLDGHRIATFYNKGRQNEY